MNDQPRVYVTRMIPPDSLELLQQAEVDLHIWDQETAPPRPKLLDELALADGVIAMLTEQINREALDAAPRLRVISNFAVGYDNVDVAAASERGIPVGNTPGVLTETTADQAFMLILAAARRVVEAVAYVQTGQWQTWYPTQMLGHDVHGATLGIIGLGRIGYAVAKRAQGFGMQILYYGGHNDEFAQRSNAKEVGLETLLEESDFVSLHVPLTENTRHLIAARELDLMKETAILINTARGAIVDSDALVEALRNKSIAYAALDVTDPEPIPQQHPLLSLKNCIVVPHLGSATWQTRELMGRLAVENLLAGLRAERLPHCVNPEVYRAQ